MPDKPSEPTIAELREQANVLNDKVHLLELLLAAFIHMERVEQALRPLINPGRDPDDPPYATNLRTQIKRTLDHYGVQTGR